jgi:hypothetical protein
MCESNSSPPGTLFVVGPCPTVASVSIAQDRTRPVTPDGAHWFGGHAGPERARVEQVVLNGRPMLRVSDRHGYNAGYDPTVEALARALVVDVPSLVVVRPWAITADIARL